MNIKPHLKLVKTCVNIEVPPTHLKHNYCTETRVLDFADGSVQLLNKTAIELKILEQSHKIFVICSYGNTL